MAIIHKCTDCRIVVGVVGGTVHLKNVTNCELTVVIEASKNDTLETIAFLQLCGQLIVDSCSNVTIYARAKRKTIVCGSYEVKVGPHRICYAVRRRPKAMSYKLTYDPHVQRQSAHLAMCELSQLENVDEGVDTVLKPLLLESDCDVMVPGQVAPIVIPYKQPTVTNSEMVSDVQRGA